MGKSPTPSSLLSVLTSAADPNTLLGGLFKKTDHYAVERFRVLLYIGSQATISGTRGLKECTKRLERRTRHLGLGHDAFVEFALKHLDAQECISTEPVDTVIARLVDRCNHPVDKCPFDYPSTIFISALLTSLVKLPDERKRALFVKLNAHFLHAGDADTPEVEAALHVIHTNRVRLLKQPEQGAKTHPPMLTIPMDAFD